MRTLAKTERLCYVIQKWIKEMIDFRCIDSEEKIH